MSITLSFHIKPKHINHLGVNITIIMILKDEALLLKRLQLKEVLQIFKIVFMYIMRGPQIYYVLAPVGTDSGYISYTEA